MAKLEDIIKQLQFVLPKYTNLFTEDFEILNVTDLGSKVFNIETASPHGLINSNYVNIEKALVKNELLIAEDKGLGQVLFTTKYYHDLTEGYHTEVYISGFTNITDGYYPLFNVPARNAFTCTLPNMPIGNGYLCEDRIDGIFGRFEVTVIDTTNFRITVPNSNFSDYIIASNLNSRVIARTRISGAADPDEFIKYYSEQDSKEEYWLFVVNGETSVTNNKRNDSDSINRVDKSDDFFIECYQPFFIYVIALTPDTYGARLISDGMIDIRKFLCKSLCGVEFNSHFAGEPMRFRTSYSGDSIYEYSGAYYVHIFEFENVFTINQVDTVENQYSRAFGFFDIDIKLPFDDFIIPKTEIKGELP